MLENSKLWHTCDVRIKVSYNKLMDWINWAQENCWCWKWFNILLSVDIFFIAKAILRQPPLALPNEIKVQFGAAHGNERRRWKKIAFSRRVAISLGYWWLVSEMRTDDLHLLLSLSCFIWPRAILQRAQIMNDVNTQTPNSVSYFKRIERIAVKMLVETCAQCSLSLRVAFNVFLLRFVGFGFAENFPPYNIYILVNRMIWIEGKMTASFLNVIRSNIRRHCWNLEKLYLFVSLRENQQRNAECFQ